MQETQQLLNMVQSGSSIVYNDISNILSWTTNWVVSVLPKLQELWINVMNMTLPVLQDFYNRFLDYLLLINIFQLIWWLIVSWLISYIWIKFIKKWMNMTDDYHSNNLDYIMWWIFILLIPLWLTFYNFTKLDDIIKLKTVPELIVIEKVMEFKDFINRQ